MGRSQGEFTRYPRTEHLFGSQGTDDDRHLGEAESLRFVSDESLIAGNKIDGTNLDIHFSDSGELVLQCRGHLITEGMHPQYELFKQWAAPIGESKQSLVRKPEWVPARHCKATVMIGKSGDKSHV